MAGQNSPKKFLSEREVHGEYGLGTRFLRRRRMRNAGPPFVKVSGQLGVRGGRILYERAALEAWLASQPVGGGETAGAQR